MQDELRWDDLRFFLATARAGTLQQAASTLDVNASTVLRRLRALEADLDAPLFIRDRKGYALTELGASIVTRAEDVEESVLSLRRAVHGHDRTAAGPVTITMVPSLFKLLAPHLLALRQVHPRLELRIRSAAQALTLGDEADIAIRATREPPPAAVGRPIGKVRWRLYRRRGARGDHGDAGYTGGPPWMRAWQNANLSRPLAMQVTEVPNMLTLIAMSDLRGALPESMGDGDDRLERVSDPIPESESTFWLLIHADLRRSARVRVTVDYLYPLLLDLVAGKLGAPSWS